MKLNKKTLFRASLLLLVFIFVTMMAFSQGPLLWNTVGKRAGVPAGDSGSGLKEVNNDLVTLSSGNVIGVGSAYPSAASVFANDIALRKYRGSDGLLLLSSYRDHYFANQNDNAERIILAEPYIYVLATCQFGSPSFDNDIVLFKMDTSFNLIWSVYFNGTGDMQDYAKDMGVDSYGNIYVIGNTYRQPTGNDIVLLKYDVNGSNLFTKYYSSSGTFDDFANAIAVEPNGICNVTGIYGSAAFGKRLAALKIWGNGVLLWAKFHDTYPSLAAYDNGTKITYDPSNGDVYVSGSGSDGGKIDWIIVKFAAVDGSKRWSKKFAGLDDAMGKGILFNAAGELFACGDIATTISGVVSQNIQLRKLDRETGATLFTRTFNYQNGPYGPSTDFAVNMISSPSGTIFIVGGYQLPNSSGGNDDFPLVVSYSSSGTLLWSHGQSSGMSSAFQYYHKRAFFSLSHNALFVGGFKLEYFIGAGHSGNNTMMKFGPVSLTSPNNQLREEEEKEVTISVFPNPATDFITVKSEEQFEATVELYDIAGKLITKELFNDIDKTLNVSQLPRGTYILRYRSEKSIQSKQIILN